MSLAGLGTRRGRTTIALTAAGLLLAGCGGQPAGQDITSAREAGGGGASAAPAKQQAGPAAKPSPTGEPSLPPGDPGLDAPAVPDPGTASAEPRGHGDQGHGRRARRTVPVDALLTAGDLRMMLGGSWERHPGGGDECVRPDGALGVRSMSYGGDVEGLLVETVATYRDAAAAEAAVEALGNAAAGCGWDLGSDPRLGSASVAATDGARSMAAVSAEGVVALLVGTGDFTRDRVRWGSLADIALGTSCAAAPDGCH